MIATIAEGHVDAADLLWLVAVIVFGVAGVLFIQAKAVPSALVAVGLALTALGFLLL